MKRAALASAALWSVFAAGASHAAVENRSRWAISAQGGPSLAMAPAWFSSGYDNSGAFGLRVRYDKDLQWAYAADFLHQRFSGNSETNQRLVTQPVGVMAFRSVFRSLDWNPYAVMGLGISRNERVVFSVPREWTKLSAAAGFGVEYDTHDLVTFGTELLFRHFGGPSGGLKDFQTLQVSAFVNFYLPDTWIPETPKVPLVLVEETDTTSPEATRVKAQVDLDALHDEIAAGRLPPVAFSDGRADLTPMGEQTLDKFAEILRRYPLFRIRVEGHTDNSISEAEALALSHLRADTARSYLVRRHELQAARITAIGRGSTQPIAPNDTPDGRRQNNRIEFVVVR